MSRNWGRIVAVVTWMLMGLASGGASADDHLDAPRAAMDRGADLGSLFFFLDPADNSYAVVALTVGGSITPAMNTNAGFFDAGVRFVFSFDNTGDTTADRVVTVRHSAQTSRTQPQSATVALSPVPNILPAGRQFVASTTISRSAFGPPGAPTFGDGTSAQQIPAVLTDSTSGISYFGGLIDDPFFFDAPAELAYRASRFANQTNPAILTRGRDAFAGYNTMAVVLRIPVNLLKGGSDIVGLSVAAQREEPLPPGTKVKKGDPTTRWVNVDRMGNPWVNNVFTSFAIKNPYNAAGPTQDAAGAFANDIVATLQAMQTDSTSINILTNIVVVNGDILRLNTAIPNTGFEGGTNPEAAWPNGRRPNDDVIDTLITLINNRVFQGDAVNDNELAMRGDFPFFAQPHMPFPPGAGAEDLTRN